MLDLPPLSTSPANVPFAFRRVTNGVQRHCNVSVVFAEFTVLAGETQEATDILTIFRLRPILDHMYHIFLGMDAVLVNVKDAKINFLTSPGTFRTFGFEAMLCEYCKRFTVMYDMSRHGTAVKYNIIKVYHDECSFQHLQAAVHHAHELAECGRQAKQQDSPLIQAKFSDKDCRLIIGCCDTNLMVTSCHVQFCDPARAVPRGE